MPEPTYTAERTDRPLEDLIIRALLRSPQHHATVIVYLRLLIDAEDRVNTGTIDELAGNVGLSRATTFRCLKYLREIGAVVPQLRGNRRFALVLPRTATPEQVHRLTHETHSLTHETDRLTHETHSLTHETQAELELQGVSDGGPMHNDEMPSISSPCHDAEKCDKGLSRAYICITSSNTYSKDLSNTYRDNEKPKQRARKSTTGLDKRKVHDDPLWPVLSEIQSYANSRWNVRHSLTNALGEAIGDRAMVLHRAVSKWGLTVEDAKAIIDAVPNHRFWGQKKIFETAKVFRKQENYQAILDEVRLGLKPKEKFDRKTIELAKPKSTDTVVAEEF